VKPLVPVARDSLAIMSSNAYSAALAVFASNSAKNLAETTERVGALSLEGLNGNIAPFLSASNSVRNFTGAKKAAANIRRLLRGSYLNESSKTRALQDPLSFRSLNHQVGSVYDAVANLQKLLVIQLNSSDDNPTVITGVKIPRNAGSQERSYYVDAGEIRGAVIPTNGFDPTPWAHALQATKHAVDDLTQASAQRIVKLESPEFSHLSRFLSPSPESLGFSSIDKNVAVLADENHRLSSPSAASSVPLAGGVEDVATNAPQAALSLRKMIDNAEYVTGIELMHGAQAVNLRQIADPGLKLSPAGQGLVKQYRALVPFYGEDRSLASDIEKSRGFVGGLAQQGQKKRVSPVECITSEVNAALRP
jgi:histidine ammonia-lyase